MGSLNLNSRQIKRLVNRLLEYYSRDYLLSLGYDYTNVFNYFTQENWQSNTYLLANYIYLGNFSIGCCSLHRGL